MGKVRPSGPKMALPTTILPIVAAALAATLIPAAFALQSIGCYVTGECKQSEVVFANLRDDASSCGRLCQNRDFCNYWSYDQDSRICTGLGNCDSFDGSCFQCISGNRDCGSEPPDLCHEPSNCLGGTTVPDGVFAEDSEEDCIRKCRDEETCQWSSYNAAEEVCVLTIDCPALDPCSNCTHSPRSCYPEVVLDLGDEDSSKSNRFFLVTCNGPCSDIDIILQEERGDADLYVYVGGLPPSHGGASPDASRICSSTSGGGTDSCRGVTRDEDELYVRVYAYNTYDDGSLTVTGANWQDVVDYDPLLDEDK